MSINHATTSSDPQLEPRTQTLRTAYVSGWGKWQSVIFGSVTQSSCIYDFWQCLDSILPAKGSEICHSEEAQLSCTTPVLKGFSRQTGVVFLEVKTRILVSLHSFFSAPASVTSIFNFIKWQCRRFTPRFSPKLPCCSFTHHMFSCISLLSFITSHPGLCSQSKRWKVPAVWVSVLEQTFRPQLF